MTVPVPERTEASEGVLLKPPEYQELSGPTIFLGGPIQGAPDWQAAAIEVLHGARPDLNIASPRREYLPGEFVYEKQVDWESAYLRRAAEHGSVMFWLAKEIDHDCGRSYAQTSRFEVAEWKEIHQSTGCGLVVGIEPGYTGARYIRRRFGQDCPDVPILDRLDETCRAAVDSIRIARPDADGR